MTRLPGLLISAPSSGQEDNSDAGTVAGFAGPGMAVQPFKRARLY